MNSAEYQLTVKSANQKVDDYTINCQSEWTVSRLKQHISETHVNKPNIKDQRLIYAGNLLKDSLTLRQVFFRDSLCTELTNSNKTDFTIHLVCSISSQKSQTAPGPSISTSTSPTQSAQATSTGADSNPSNSASTSSSNVASQATLITNESDQASPPRVNSMHAHDILSSLLQSDQIRQQLVSQLVSLQQLANLVASELARNLSAGLNQTNLEQASTQLQSPLLIAELQGLINLSQPIDISTHATTADTVGSVFQTEQNLDATAILNRINNGALNYNGHNLTSDNNVNNPGMRHEPDGHQLEFNHPDRAQPPAAVAGLQEPAPVQAPQGPIMEQPVPAQPGIHQVNPDPILQHDVIDWVYYSIRAMVLIAVLYIHASLFRLLFIFGLLAIAFFFSRRSNRRHNQVVAGINAAQPQPPANVANRGAAANDAQLEQAGNLRRRRVDGEGAANGENNELNGGDDANRAGTTDNVDGVGENAHDRVSFFKLCYLTVADFLASLVPE